MRECLPSFGGSRGGRGSPWSTVRGTCLAGSESRRLVVRTHPERDGDDRGSAVGIRLAANRPHLHTTRFPDRRSGRHHRRRRREGNEAEAQKSLLHPGRCRTRPKRPRARRPAFGAQPGTHPIQCLVQLVGAEPYPANLRKHRAGARQQAQLDTAQPLPTQPRHPAHMNEEVLRRLSDPIRNGHPSPFSRSRRWLSHPAPTSHDVGVPECAGMFPD